MVEARGIPTVLVSTGRDLTAQVMPPRSVFVNHPMGNPFGKPNDVTAQRTILMDALHHAVNAKAAGELKDLPYQWHEPILTIMELKKSGALGDGGYRAMAPDPKTGKQPKQE